MSRRAQMLFLLLVVFQAMHSVEEYLTHLYEVFAPARFVSGLVSADPSIGFAVVNAMLVAFGIWTYWVPVRIGYRSAWVLAWFWVVLELANGVGHVAFAVSAAGYFPGVLTAPLLAATAAALAVLLLRDGRRTVA